MKGKGLTPGEHLQKNCHNTTGEESLTESRKNMSSMLYKTFNVLKWPDSKLVAHTHAKATSLAHHGHRMIPHLEGHLSPSQERHAMLPF
jgi:hypothetical protein